MERQFEQLERLIEREQALLAQLPTPQPRPETLQRVKAAVRAEAARLGSRAAPGWTPPRWVGIAAAVLLAVGLSGAFWGSSTRVEPPFDARQQLAAWADAVADSNDRFGFLLDDGWMLESAGGENGEAIEGLLDSLETSFEHIGGTL